MGGVCGISKDTKNEKRVRESVMTMNDNNGLEDILLTG
jgi:hypothetical protein